MPPYADVYALSPSRTTEAVDHFLDRFAPSREEVTNEYEVPQYEATPVACFGRAADVIAFLADHPDEPYSLYWRNTAADGPAFVMTFFTTDGAIILGLSCAEEQAEHWLSELKAFAKANVGSRAFEQPPPETTVEFLRLCR